MESRRYPYSVSPGTLAHRTCAREPTGMYSRRSREIPNTGVVGTAPEPAGTYSRRPRAMPYTDVAAGGEGSI